MTQGEAITIRDLLEARERVIDAKLDAIVTRLDASSGESAEVRRDLRMLHEQLLGVATGAEIASLKRQVNTEIDALANRIDVVEDQLGERAAVERWRRRFFGAAGTVGGLLVGLAGVLVVVL